MAKPKETQAANDQTGTTETPTPTPTETATTATDKPRESMKMLRVAFKRLFDANIKVNEKASAENKEALVAALEASRPFVEKARFNTGGGEAPEVALPKVRKRLFELLTLEQSRPLTPEEQQESGQLSRRSYELQHKINKAAAEKAAAEKAAAEKANATASTQNA